MEIWLTRGRRLTGAASMRARQEHVAVVESLLAQQRAIEVALRREAARGLRELGELDRESELGRLLAEQVESALGFVSSAKNQELKLRWMLATARDMLAQSRRGA
jgi:hypothetical protein